ncbi:PD-(D/E)XK nuclease-like domain-containing protein [Enterococcus xiangfangensis]|uniref:PD-(D/E)XK nuclease-like domain-containing protein n=2 Tax=Enterococcus xiangfangensis TaxID=1296537 RepID=A0ABU3F9F0_9ENTE|nr:PD-(D/E)XK nuclease-like domain-containing protein [Enterococcus xiangfangensis]MDT2759300.1 PD-(D/E)XK nuclease-like domain-containing protein [Enterococcus xiangfangensis]
MEKSILSDENYYSKEADWHFMSVSQYKDFMRCPAAALAKIKGEWEPDNDKKPLLVGNYVHSYFESDQAHEAFKTDHKDKLFSSRKPFGLLKDFQIAEQMIERLKKESAFNQLYQGEKEVIVTGELFGIEWKGKIDCLNIEDGYFVDIKTTKDIHERKYDDYWGPKANFIERYGYALQMAVYRELLEQQYNKQFVPFIAAVSKQKPSDVGLITLDESKMQSELSRLEENIDHIHRVKMGQEEPTQCGQCDYCRGHKRITGFINMNDL